jgi:hypothetical protein
MANRSTLLRLYVAVTTETTGGLSKFAIEVDEVDFIFEDSRVSGEDANRLRQE